VREVLDQAATTLLRRVAANHGLAVDDSTTRTELVERLSQRLTDPAYLTAQLETLDPREQRVLNAARSSGGELRGFLLSRILESDDPDAPRSLLERGFLFRTFAPLGPHRGEVFAVPDEVLALLAPVSGHDATPGAVLPPIADAPPREEWRGSDPSFSLFALASYLQRHMGGHGGADAGARAAGFQAETHGWAREPGGWPWQERWAFLRHVGLAAGFLERRTDGTTSTSVRSHELLSDRPRLMRRLWRSYLRDREWSEAIHADVPQAERLAEQLDAPAARTAVLRVLARLPPGEWVTLSDLCAWLEASAPAFLRQQLDARSAALVDPTTGEPLLAEGSWARVEARYLRYLVLGPLYWLGAMGADTSGERVAVTPTGSVLLADSEGVPARPPDRCTWDASSRLLAPARADLGALLQAERYLLLEARGQPSRYRLDRDRIAVALSAGGSIQECRQLLVRLMQHSLPADIEARLSTWEHGFGAIALRPAVLLEARSQSDLDSVEEVTTVRPFIRRRLNPRVAEVAASQAPALVDELHSAGHLPRVDAALRLMSGRHAYAAMIDERVLEFLLTCLLALREVRPEHLAHLEGSLDLLERLEDLFPPEQLKIIREAAAQLAGTIRSAPRAISQRSPRRRSRSRG
jgi:hypothetical protein